MHCFAKFCRLCLNTGDLIDFYMCKNEISSYDKIKMLIPALVVKSNKHFPSWICLKCDEQLTNFYQFQKICFYTNNLLETYLKQLTACNVTKVINEVNPLPNLDNIVKSEIKEEIIESSTLALFDKNTLPLYENLNNDVSTSVQQENVKLDFSSFFAENIFSISAKNETTLLQTGQTQTNSNEFILLQTEQKNSNETTLLQIEQTQINSNETNVLPTEQTQTNSNETNVLPTEQTQTNSNETTLQHTEEINSNDLVITQQESQINSTEKTNQDLLNTITKENQNIEINKSTEEILNSSELLCEQTTGLKLRIRRRAQKVFYGEQSDIEDTPEEYGTDNDSDFVPDDKTSDINENINKSNKKQKSTIIDKANINSDRASTNTISECNLQINNSISGTNDLSHYPVINWNAVYNSLNNDSNNFVENNEISTNTNNQNISKVTGTFIRDDTNNVNSTGSQLSTNDSTSITIFNENNMNAQKIDNIFHSSPQTVESSLNDHISSSNNSTIIDVDALEKNIESVSQYKPNSVSVQQFSNSGNNCLLKNLLSQNNTYPKTNENINIHNSIFHPNSQIIESSLNSTSNSTLDEIIDVDALESEEQFSNAPTQSVSIQNKFVKTVNLYQNTNGCNTMAYLKNHTTYVERTRKHYFIDANLIIHRPTNQNYTIHYKPNSHLQNNPQNKHINNPQNKPINNPQNKPIIKQIINLQTSNVINNSSLENFTKTTAGNNYIESTVTSDGFSLDSDSNSLQYLVNNSPSLLETTDNSTIKSENIDLLDLRILDPNQEPIDKIDLTSVRKKYVCRICSQHFKKSDELEIHLKSHAGEFNFICLICDKLFESKTELKDHLNKKHLVNNPHFIHFYLSNEIQKFFKQKSLNIEMFDINKNKCSICNKSFKKLYLHMQTHRTFVCGVCDYETFDSHKKFTSHAVRHHALRNVNCWLCCNQFPEMDDLLVHILSHYGFRIYTCPECKRQNEFLSKHYEHMKFIHKKEQLQCVFCEKTTKPAIKKMTNHIIEFHEGERSACPYCGNTYEEAEQLSKHMIANHCIGVRHTCDICGKSYRKKKLLAHHQEMNHSNKEANLSCNVCNHKFKTTRSLHLHKLLHIESRKRFACKHCNKKFMNNHLLANHGRIHNGEKPFECEVCSKKFAQKVTLEVHSRIHTGFKPYKCEPCGKAYSQSYVYKLHMKKYHEQDYFTKKIEISKPT